jgi:hypothetical protein
MGEMVERVKAAIKLNIENAQIGKDGRVFDKYELAAKAAIEAMREGLGNTGQEFFEGYDILIRTEGSMADAKECYRNGMSAVIDEALK